jgi:hypothetical protein
VSINVRCTATACRAQASILDPERRCGLGKAAHIGAGPAGELLLGHRYRPCGWRGERHNLHIHMYHYHYDAIGQNRTINPAWVQAVTAKPCPRCGGTVELIDQDGAS